MKYDYKGKTIFVGINIHKRVDSFKIDNRST